MNEKYCIEICNILSLGTLITTPKAVLGGLIHHMWHIQTDHGSYAIKELSKNILLTYKIREQYEITEKIAKEFLQRGIPAVTSIAQKNGLSLIDVENDTYIVYPWVEAHTITAPHITIEQASIIAHLLAQMHQMRLHMPRISMPLYTIESSDRIQQLHKKSKELNFPFCRELTDNLDMLLTINARYATIIPLMEQNTVISHGDLDPKNVLWNSNNQPLLIDWESARLLNPTQEIVNGALDWSGITAGTFNWEIFKSMLETYQTAGGILALNGVEASLIAISENWLNWLLFNIQRSISLANGRSPEYQERIKQVNQTLRTIQWLENNRAALVSVCCSIK